MICKYCEKEYSDFYNFCPGCGATAEKAETAKKRKGPREKTDRLYCGNCNTELDEGSAFCPVCGQKGVNKTTFDKLTFERIGVLYCPRCGNPLNAGDTECVICHCPVPSAVPGKPEEPVPASAPKNRWVALVLLLLFGALGIHRFYAGRTGSAALMLCSSLFGALFSVAASFTVYTAIVWLVLALVLLLIVLIMGFTDFLQILIGCFKDGEGRPLR